MCSDMNQNRIATWPLPRLESINNCLLMSQRILGAKFEWPLVFDTSLPGRQTHSLILTFATFPFKYLSLLKPKNLSDVVFGFL